jgi:hypothetical protein
MALELGEPGEVYNFGSGKPVKIADLLHTAFIVISIVQVTN